MAFATGPAGWHLSRTWLRDQLVEWLAAAATKLA
jgi:hypothetical protein